MNPLVLAATTIVVLIAFAANSVLGRMALKPEQGQLIDPAVYTLVRMSCGAFVLLCIQLAQPSKLRGRDGSRVTFWHWLTKSGYDAPCMLTLYAVAFSFAYVQLDAAKGTLILFTAVQLTMVTLSAFRGERPRLSELVGLAVASAGLFFLLSGSPAAQDASSSSELVRASLVMVGAGIGWGAYSILGKGSSDPIGDTARNFMKSVPVVLVVSIVFLGSSSLPTTKGFALAAASGGLTSGLGYVLWYTVLPHLRSAQAAAVQLSTPIVAAIGGFVFANDPITSKTAVAGTIILGGIALTIRWRKPASPDSETTTMVESEEVVEER